MPNFSPTDPLGFEDKKCGERIVAERQRTGLRDAVLTGSGMIHRRVAFGVTDYCVHHGRRRFGRR